YQPNAIIAPQGPDARWVGNEQGIGDETEWSRFPSQVVFHGSADGIVWYPAECDVSIRQGWFYHEEQNSQIKSVEHLIDIYFKSVGRNSNLLLNVPPDKDGLFTGGDVIRLREWRTKLDEIFSRDVFLNKKASCSNYRYAAAEYSPAQCLDNNRKTFWAADKDTLKAELIIDMEQQEKINIIKLEEAIEYGQRIAEFKIYAEINGDWQEITSGTTVGRTRLLKFEPVTASKIKIKIVNSLAAPTLRTLSAYYAEF
ncbi:MAG TPA: discoidin domain-containing protein, partial [Ignavibacteriales bacterium]|nr:discoidin domain-containing protein [Ignavibacteriales bacterium]